MKKITKQIFWKVFLQK